MVWKLFDKEERLKIQTLHQIAVCSVCDRPDALEHNKEFCMGKHEGFHTALWRPGLDELE